MPGQQFTLAPIETKGRTVSLTAAHLRVYYFAALVRLVSLAIFTACRSHAGLPLRSEGRGEDKGGKQKVQARSRGKLHGCL